MIFFLMDNIFPKRQFQKKKKVFFSSFKMFLYRTIVCNNFYYTKINLEYVFCALEKSEREEAE